jgi:hypothetical protein
MVGVVPEIDGDLPARVILRRGHYSFIPTVISSRTQLKLKNGWCWWGGRPWPPIDSGHGGPPHRVTVI